MNNIITLQFEQYLQEKIIAGQHTDLNEIIFAYIPNLDITSTDRNITLPPESQWVHTQAVNQIGTAGENAVVYSVVLAANATTFTFNAMFLRDKNHANGLAVAVYKAEETKEPSTVLIKSIVTEFIGAAEAGNITVEAETWQVDFSQRVNSLDSDISQAVVDLSGKNWFVEQGFLVEENGSAYTVRAGVGYVGGYRIEIKSDETIQVPNKPSFIYIDAHRTQNSQGQQTTEFTFVVSATELADYIDANVQHYICKIAQILIDNAVIDLREKNKTSLVTALNSSQIRSLSQRFADVINVKDFATIQAALDFAATLNRANLVFFPTDEYKENIVINTTLILVGNSSILRAKNSSTVIDVVADAKIFGFAKITGQTESDELITNGSNNTTAAHAIRATNASLYMRDVDCIEGGRFDSLYISTRDKNKKYLFENCNLLSSARNPVSIIAGHNFVFRDCKIQIDNRFFSANGNGLYLFDHEPNSAEDTSNSYLFENVVFENDGEIWGNDQIIFHETHLNEANHIDAIFKECKFLKASIRPETNNRKMSGLVFENCLSTGRLLSAVSNLHTLINSKIFNHELISNETSSLTYAVALSDNCIAENISNDNFDTVSIAVDTSSNVQLINVKGQIRALKPNHKIDSRTLNISDITNFTDILKIPRRSSVKITLAGADASEGILGMHYSECIAVTSNDAVIHAPIEIKLNIANAGADVQWKSTDPYADDSLIWQFKPQSVASNNWIVQIELLTSNNSNIEWLI